MTNKANDIPIIEDRSICNKHFSYDDNIIALTFDDGYIEQIINLIYSVTHFNKNISFICYCFSLSQCNIEKILSLSCGISVIFCRQMEEIDTGRWSKTTILRLFIPWLIDERVEKLIYLDGDMICKGNIDELISYTPKTLALCYEISGNVSDAQKGNFKKLFPHKVYCNAGFVYFNLKSIREHHKVEDVYNNLAKNLSKYPFFDQDLLNTYFANEIEMVDPLLYNFQMYEFIGSVKYKKIIGKCKIIHFSVGKPWDYKTKRTIIKKYREYTFYPEMKKYMDKVLFKNTLYMPIKVFVYIKDRIKNILK